MTMLLLLFQIMMLLLLQILLQMLTIPCNDCWYEIEEEQLWEDGTLNPVAKTSKQCHCDCDVGHKLFHLKRHRPNLQGSSRGFKLEGLEIVVTDLTKRFPINSRKKHLKFGLAAYYC